MVSGLFPRLPSASVACCTPDKKLGEGRLREEPGRSLGEEPGGGALKQGYCEGKLRRAHSLDISEADRWVYSKSGCE